MNRATFCDFHDWTDDRGLDPQWASSCSSTPWDLSGVRQMQFAWQPGAFESRYAPDPLVPLFKSKADHFPRLSCCRTSLTPLMRRTTWSSTCSSLCSGPCVIERLFVVFVLSVSRTYVS